MGLERDLELLRDIISGVSQLVMSVNNAIDKTAYDLNAASFSETTALANDFILDNVEINFTTTAIRDITITSSDGTVLKESKEHIDKDFVWSALDMGFNGGENITISITQTGAACLVDVKLRARSGSNTLVGNPDVRIVDSVGNVYEDAIRSRCMPVIDIDHFFTHGGATFSCSDVAIVPAASSKYFLIIPPPINQSHLITFHFTSTQANAEVILYGPDATVSANGGLCTLLNKNQNSSNTAETRLYIDPVDPVEGAQMEHDLIVGGKQSGGSAFSESGEEWVMNSNASSKYLVKYVNNSNQEDVMDWKITFLEPAKL